MPDEAVTPPEIMPSAYSPPPARRAASLPRVISLRVTDLFPEIPRAIYAQGGDVAAVRRATEEALSTVGMDMIRARDTVNILCTEHGGSIMGGHAYAEMLRTIKDVVQARTGCANIRLRVAAGAAGFKETREFIRDFGFADYFGKTKVAGFGPWDKGVAIETEVGTLYGVASAYDADWFIHAHYDDPREAYVHHLIDRTAKAFGMSFARFETRALYHMVMGNRSGNFIGKVILDSPFVQQKFTFSTFLMTSPDGVLGVDADNDLTGLNKRLITNLLASFGKLMRLFLEIDECVVVVDGGRHLPYVHAGGLTLGHLLYGRTEYIDLDNTPAVLSETMNFYNPAIRALVVHQAWTGLPLSVGLPMAIPTIVAGQEMADMIIGDSANPAFMSQAVIAEDLDAAVAFAKRIAGTDKLIVFDGSFTSINLSPSMAAFLTEKAPAVRRTVDEELMPRWLKQRGIDPAGQGICTRSGGAS